MSNNTLHKLGIDIGSTTVKVAVLDENDNLLFSELRLLAKFGFVRCGEIHYAGDPRIAFQKIL